MPCKKIPIEDAEKIYEDLSKKYTLLQIEDILRSLSSLNLNKMGESYRKNGKYRSIFKNFVSVPIKEG
jgi:hypothetical protein